MEQLERRALFSDTGISVSNVSAVEGDGVGSAIVFTVERSGDLSSPCSVTYATADGTALAGHDYSATSGTLAFAAGQARADIPVPLIGNTKLQQDRTFTLNLSLPALVATANYEIAYNASVARFDANLDGVDDIASVGVVSSNYTNTMTIFSGDAQGQLHPVHVPVPQSDYFTNQLTTGDFNGDGLPDIVTNWREGMRFFRGAGDGSFQQESKVYAYNGYVGAMQSADFNGDSKLDIAVANTGGSNVFILRGDGNGSFQASSGIYVGSSPTALGVADFNGDGRPDIVSANFGGTTIAVLIADQHGSFLPAVSYPGGGRPNSVVTADFNGDGKVDLAAGSDGEVTVLLGNGDGTFGDPIHAVTELATSLVAADFNLDGHMDLAYLSNGKIGIASGNGDGSFGPAVYFATHDALTSMLSSDFNHDNRPDLAVVVSIYDAGDEHGRLTVLQGQSSSTRLLNSSAIGTIHDDDAPAWMQTTVGSRQSASVTIGTALESTVGVRLSNLRGSPVEGIAIHFVAPGSGPSGSFAGTGSTVTVTTNASGVAITPAFTANAVGGTYTIIATAATGTAVPVIFTLTNSAQAATYAASEYFPMAGGNSWSFTGSQKQNGANPQSFSDERTSRVTSLGGVPVTEFVDSLSRSGYSNGGLGKLVRDYGLDESHGLRLFSQDTGGAPMTFLTSPLPVLAPTPYVGQVLAWTNTPVSVEVSGRIIGGASTGTSRVDSVTPFDLPGGMGTVYVLNVTIDHTEHYTIDGESVTVHELEVFSLARDIGLVTGSASVVATATDVDGTDTQTVSSSQRISGIHVTPFASAPGQLLGGSSGMTGTLNVTSKNGDGAPIILQQQAGSAAWTGLDLQATTDCPPIVGEVTTWVDPKDGLNYAAAMTSSGLVLFTNTNNSNWYYRNLSGEVPGIPAITGNLTVFTALDGMVNIAGTATSGDLIRWVQIGTAAGGYQQWSASNLGDDLRTQGLTVPQFTGRITSFVTSWNALNVVGLDANGQIQAVWWHHTLNTGGKWTTNNLSAQTGAPALTGGLTVWLTSWNAINIAGADSKGNLSTTWWVAGYNNNAWQTSDLSSLVSGGGPKLQASSMTSWVTSWGAMNIAGREADGSLGVYWWVPGYNDDKWQVMHFRDDVPNATPTVGPVTGLTAPGGDFSMSILSTSATGDVIREWWSPSTGVWSEQNLSLAAIPA